MDLFIVLFSPASLYPSLALSKCVSCPQLHSGEIHTLQNSVDWWESCGEKQDQSSLTCCCNQTHCEKPGGKWSGCVLRMEEWSTQELFSGLEESYPCDCMCSCGVQGGLVARLDQSFVLILWAESGQLRGMRRANPSIKTWSISPNNLVYSWAYANVGAAKLP